MLQMVDLGDDAAADDDCYDPRPSSGFMSCLVPPPKCIDCPKPKGYRHLSFDQLDKQPLRLTVLKLDGSSFGIEVEQAGTVRDLKCAVEAAFHHLPKKGPQSVSWEHVWGQFCLCHEGQKLLNDGDYIGMIRIRDSDQVEFIRYASYTHQLVGAQSRLKKLDSDDECDYSNGSWDKHQNNDKDGQICLGTPLDGQDDVISCYDYSLTHPLRGRFSYHKFSSQPRDEKSSSSSGFSNNILGSLKNCLRISCNKRYSRRQILRGE